MQRGMSNPGKESTHSSNYVPVDSKPDGTPIAKPGRPHSTVNAPSVGFINSKLVLTKAVSINSTSVVYGNGISDTNSTQPPIFRVLTPARNGGPLPGRVEGQRRPPPASRSTSTSTSGMCSDSNGSGSDEGTTGAIRTRKVSSGAQSLHDMPLAAVLPSARLTPLRRAPVFGTQSAAEEKLLERRPTEGQTVPPRWQKCPNTRTARQARAPDRTNQTDLHLRPTEAVQV